ncbi:hypothetical protein [Roseomonas sp. KE2513]|uniref:hypothetical protein n=1 Tax=Roseomonas sp. KE2513 TaxID=2479202 RepID=UPI0018E02F8F|nr:hypothetical protein [Roseomonas sp. KE2513]
MAKPESTAKRRPPADGSGQKVLDRMRALAESIRRQMAARRQNRARPGGPGVGPGGR